MGEGAFESLKTVFYYGSNIVLNQSWHGYDVTCPYSKIYFVTDGEIAVKVGETEYVLRENDCALIPSGVEHSFYHTELQYGKKRWFHFDVTQGGASFFDKYDFSYVTHVNEPDKLNAFFDVIDENKEGGQAHQMLAVTSAVAGVVSMFLQNANAAARGLDNEIDRTISYMEANVERNFSLEELSSRVHLSPNYFIRKFKERTGFSPIKYANMLKIERTKDLLENSDLPVSAVMSQVGLYDAAYFSRLFKANTGHTPRQFRAIYGKSW